MSTLEAIPDLAAELQTLRSDRLANPKVLLVDDNESILTTLAQVLRRNDFDVVTARNVADALKCIVAEPFDVLLSDLHMPEAGDGLTVVSAMRHANAKAVRLLLSGYPAMNQAAAAILLQADEVLLKPIAVDLLVKTIRGRLAKGSVSTQPVVESMATVLESQVEATIGMWLAMVSHDAKITVPMDDAERSAYLPQMFRDLVYRLRNPLPLGTRAHASASASAHGMRRRELGYTAAMLVEESRMLQVSIFQTLQNNLSRIDFSLLLVGVMAIADEVDSQLAQQMTSYVAESHIDSGPIVP